MSWAQERGRDDAELYLRVCRLGCMGKCPAYCFSLEKDGSIHFDPIKNTRSRLPVKRKASAFAKNEAKRLLERAWIFERESSYEYGGDFCKRYETDQQVFTIQSLLANKSIELTVDEGCGEIDHTLIELPSLLERVLGLENNIR